MNEQTEEDDLQDNSQDNILNNIQNYSLDIIPKSNKPLIPIQMETLEQDQHTKENEQNLSKIYKEILNFTSKESGYLKVARKRIYSPDRDHLVRKEFLPD